MCVCVCAHACACACACVFCNVNLSVYVPVQELSDPHISHTLLSHTLTLHPHDTILTLTLPPSPLHPSQGDGSGVEDWRGELLQAVERILDHEHSLLASAVRGREEEEEGENKPLHQKVRVLQLSNQINIKISAILL